MSDIARPEPGPPSAFFREHQHRLPATGAIGPVLDLACGDGRHALAAARMGLSVVALDRDRERLDALARIDVEGPGRIEVIELDLEAPEPPDLETGGFGGVLVFRYLHRPLAAWIESLLAPGGVLLYETFLRSQRELGWGPRRDAFLLEPGELAGLFPGLEVLIFEEGPSAETPPAQTARLLAARPA